MSAVEKMDPFGPADPQTEDIFAIHDTSQEQAQVDDDLIDDDDFVRALQELNVSNEPEQDASVSGVLHLDFSDDVFVGAQYAYCG